MDIIFDMDGTIMDVAHRVHFLEGSTRDWRSFHNNMIHDKPFPEMLELLKLIIANDKNQIIFCTGRSDEYRQETLHQINMIFHEVQEKKSSKLVPHIHLYIRKNSDHRADAEVKSDLYAPMIKDGFEPTMVFEDRSSVVKMWRKRGLRCLQVADGDF